LNTTPSLQEAKFGPKINETFDFAILTAADNLGYDPAKFNYGNANDVELGDTVYYGGYPFSARTPHIHKGTVSAIEEDISSGKRSFKIDGTAVKGMSGGPVFILKLDTATNSYKPTIIGFLASETFDPVDNFDSAVQKLFFQLKNAKTTEDHNTRMCEDFANSVREMAVIKRGYFYSDGLNNALEKYPHGDYRNLIWDDLRNADIFTDEGELNFSNFSKDNVLSALRDDFKPHVALVMKRLDSLHKAATMNADDLEGADLLGTIAADPTDDLARVAMSLTNSISTGIVTGYFLEDALKDLVDYDPSKHFQFGAMDFHEFDIGREYDRLFKEKQAANKGAPDNIIHEQIIEEVTTMAGLYGDMLHYSKKKIIESDHFPPKSVYKMAKDAHIKNLSETQMVSLNLKYQVHRKFITTGSRKEVVEFRARQEKFFAQGKYYDAIDINIEEYQKAGIITDGNKSALAKGLDLHVTNKLITAQQRHNLIAKYNLAPPAPAILPPASTKSAAKAIAKLGLTPAPAPAAPPPASASKTSSKKTTRSKTVFKKK
ncbi:MAG: serine protease, partial [Gammaproteobacteria bacterium]|nr:serine protease [Gammaproteobacteria bacterium]